MYSLLKSDSNVVVLLTADSWANPLLETDLWSADVKILMCEMDVAVKYWFVLQTGLLNCGVWFVILS